MRKHMTMVLANIDSSRKSLSLADLSPKAVKEGLEILVESREALGLIEEVILDNSKLRNFPSSQLAQLPNLASVSVENNCIRTLPNELGKDLPNVERLHLDCNQLVMLPPSVGLLGRLTRLFLENNALLMLPAEIGQLTSLKWLSLDQNRLTSLPPELADCRQLQYLSVDANNLTDLPKEIFQMKTLATFSVLDNPQLTQLPFELSHRPDLVFRFNAVCSIPLHLLPQPNKTAGSDIHNTRDIFEFLQNIVVRHNLRFDPKAHWQPDSDSPSCTKCSSSFTVTKRRHHCRLCGRVFCKKCCSMVMNLPVMGSSRICVDCFSSLAQEHAHLIARPSLAERPDELSLMIQSLTGMKALSPSEWVQLDQEAQKLHLTKQLQQVSEALDVQESILGSIEEGLASEKDRRDTIRLTDRPGTDQSAKARSQNQWEETKKKIKFLEAAKNRITVQLEQLERKAD